MIAFGRFLELSLPAPDVLESLDFYRRLGFAEWITGDIRRWHYAVVSDGRMTIGLHQQDVEEPTLSFVRPEVARQVRALEAQGHSFEWQRLGSDDFHEATLRTPDGQLIRMMEARTFSPADVPSRSLLGAGCAEVTQHCHDPVLSRTWLETVGFVAENASGEDVPLHVTAPGLRLGLRTGRPQAVVSLRFRLPDPAASARVLANSDFDMKKTRDGYELRAPEGTRLLIDG